MIAFVFPGQGSQYPGMARDLTMCPEYARRYTLEAEQATGLDITGLMSSADTATIADPQIAQLLVFVSSSAMLAQLRENGVAPDLVAGHSLGEYTALMAAGCLEWSTAVRLVAERGAAMSAEARKQPGTMGAVVGLPASAVQDLCRDVTASHGTVVLANLNSARQVVVSGIPAAVDAVLAGARAAGAVRARRLPVGGAYHSALMADAEQVLAWRIAEAPLRHPKVPFVSSVTGDVVDDIAAYRSQLRRQVTRPVHWHATVDTLAALGARYFVEVGPGRVLSGLGREIVRGGDHVDSRSALLKRSSELAGVGSVANAS